LYTPKPDPSPAPPVREGCGVWNSPVTKEKSLLRPWEFRFLNHSHSCRFPGDWNSPGLEKLWLYNLHYFDDLTTAAAKSSKLHRELLELWIEGNPPGRGNGWEPYPISLRVVNWIKWVLAGNTPPAHFVQSLAMQVRFLCERLEYHLLGNHLFANAKALVFAGMFFNGTEAEKWFSWGMAILRKEIPEQILSDGAHFERTPMYHTIILEDMLDMANLFQAYGKDLPTSWRDKIEAMLTWLAGMIHPDGQISLFNDSALGIAAEPEEIFAYAGCLRLDSEKKKTNHQFLSFPESGYIRWESDSALVLLDVGEIGPEYLPGHAHADTLSFEMSLYGQRVIVDSGTSCYGISDERLRQRQTSAHNTVSVDGEDSSEVWSGFRVARRARPCDMAISEHQGKVKVRCSHDGYLRLPGKVKHRREWTLAEQEVIITDTLSGEYGTACARLFFHPKVEIERTEANCFRALLADERFANIKVKGGSTELRKSTYHPCFGVVEKNLSLHILFSGNQCVTIISW
jgi:uncharacterized heparinase superfamily protein